MQNRKEKELSHDARKLKHVLEHKLPINTQEPAVKDLVKIIKACSTEELAALGLQPPAAPVLSSTLLAGNSSTLPLPQRLQAVQDIICSLQYNYNSNYLYNVCKQRPLSAILATAAGILRDPLPIKCIEAVFLALLLTQGWSALQRIPMGFKSCGSNGQVYRHIVLVVCQVGSDGVSVYGALGLSRRSELMFKPLQFSSLAELVADYQQGYRRWGHQLTKVRVGLPVEHDTAYLHLPVCWRYCTVSPEKRSWESVAVLLNRHAAAAASLQQQYRTTAACHSSSSSSSLHSSPTIQLTAGSLVSSLVTQQQSRHMTRPNSRGAVSNSIDMGSLSRRRPQGGAAPVTCLSLRQGADLTTAAAMLSPRYNMMTSKQSNTVSNTVSSSCNVHGLLVGGAGFGGPHKGIMQSQKDHQQSSSVLSAAATGNCATCSGCADDADDADDGGGEGCGGDECDSDSEDNPIVAAMRRSPSPP